MKGRVLQGRFGTNRGLQEAREQPVGHPSEALINSLHTPIKSHMEANMSYAQL